MSLTVRRYDPADSEAVQRVHERALRASPLESVADAPSVVGVPEDYLDVGGEFLVGAVDGTVVAVGGFSREDEATAELQRVRVDPDHQRNGYGERILTELEERARARGFERAVLDTDARLTAARQLYRKHGYETVDRPGRRDVPDGVVYYEKALVD